VKRIPIVLGAGSGALALIVMASLLGPKPSDHHGLATHVTSAGQQRRPASARDRHSAATSRSVLASHSVMVSRGVSASESRRASQQTPASKGYTTSKGYAGYAVRERRGSFQFVQATFFVPYLNCVVSPAASSSAWVGFDYLLDGAREAVGVEADCSAGAPTYFSWYQAAANATSPVQRDFKVNAGDSITASVTFSTDHRFVLTLTDNTTGKFSTKYASCSTAKCVRSSAEVISEATPVSGVIQPLADYGAESFTGISVTDLRGNNAGFYARWWRATKIIQVGAGSKVIGQPTGLRLGTAFDNYWLGES